MKVIKYVVELQTMYSLDETTSALDPIAEFDSLNDALNELGKVAYIHANNKNVAIEVVKYEFDEENQEYVYLENVIGLYGIEAAKHLNLDASKKKKYGLIVF